MTELEQNTINDFREQLTSIKKNIVAENNKLEAVFKTKEVEAADMEKKRIAHNVAIAELVRIRTELDTSIVTDRNVLTADVRHFESNKREWEHKKLDEERKLANGFAELEREKQLAENSLLSLREESQGLILEVQAVSERVDDLSKQQNELSRSIEALEQEKRFIEIDIADVSKRRDETVALADKEIKAKQAELIALEKRVAEETEKVRLPKENLLLMQADMVHRTEQLEIIYQRTKKAWARIYPNQDIDNVLK